MTRYAAAGLLLIAGLLPATSLLAADCPAHRQQVNDNNSLILLGGTAKGDVKQFVMGEFGKDVDQQRRLLGEFDRCGALVRADLSYDKQEGGLTLNMVQSILQVKEGWEAVYEVSVMVMRDGKQVEVNHKQGTVNYVRGKNGSIVSASDRFLLQGKTGFTETTNSFDGKQRLVKSVARGSDTSSNGITQYRWDAHNQLKAMNSDSGKMDFSYDKQGREQKLVASSSSENSTTTSTDECQLWDEKGNCTLSYSHETEVFSKGAIKRNLSAAYRFEYWDAPKSE